MRRLMRLGVGFLRKEDGPTATEYAVMLALIAVVCIAAVTTLKSDKQQDYDRSAYDVVEQEARKKYQELDEPTLREHRAITTERLQSEPDNPEVPVQLGVIAEFYAKGDGFHAADHWKSASVHYAKALELWEAIAANEASDPDQRSQAPKRIAEIRLLLGNTYKQLGKKDEAKEQYQKAADAPSTKARAQKALRDL